MARRRVLRSKALDVAVSRERRRLARLRRLGLLLAPFWIWLVIRLVNGEPIALGPPSLPDNFVLLLPGAPAHPHAAAS